MNRILIAALLIVFLAAIASAQAPPAPATTDQMSPQGMTVAQMEARGDSLRQQKMYEQALVFYRAALKLDKNNAKINNKAGIAELQLNDTSDARRYFERAAKLNKTYADAINNLGVVAYLRKDYGRAVKEYKRALALDETNPSFHSNLGTAWFEQKKYDKAMIEFARALQLDPEILLRSSSFGVSARIATPEERAYYSYVLAKLYARAGDVERSLHCLQMAKEQGYNKLRDVYKEQECASMRSDPRLTQIVPPEAD